MLSPEEEDRESEGLDAGEAGAVLGPSTSTQGQVVAVDESQSSGDPQKLQPGEPFGGAQRETSVLPLADGTALPGEGMQSQPAKIVTPPPEAAAITDAVARLRTLVNRLEASRTEEPLPPGITSALRAEIARLQAIVEKVVPQRTASAASGDVFQQADPEAASTSPATGELGAREDSGTPPLAGSQRLQQGIVDGSRDDERDPGGRGADELGQGSNQFSRWAKDWWNRVAGGGRAARRRAARRAESEESSAQAPSGTGGGQTSLEGGQAEVSGFDTEQTSRDEPQQGPGQDSRVKPTEPPGSGPGEPSGDIRAGSEQTDGQDDNDEGDPPPPGALGGKPRVFGSVQVASDLELGSLRASVATTARDSIHVGSSATSTRTIDVEKRVARFHAGSSVMHLGRNSAPFDTLQACNVTGDALRYEEAPRLSAGAALLAVAGSSTVDAGVRDPREHPSLLPGSPSAAEIMTWVRGSEGPAEGRGPGHTAARDDAEQGRKGSAPLWRLQLGHRSHQSLLRTSQPAREPPAPLGTASCDAGGIADGTAETHERREPVLVVDLSSRMSDAQLDGFAHPDSRWEAGPGSHSGGEYVVSTIGSSIGVPSKLSARITASGGPPEGSPGDCPLNKGDDAGDQIPEDGGQGRSFEEGKGSLYEEGGFEGSQNEGDGDESGLDERINGEGMFYEGDGDEHFPYEGGADEGLSFEGDPYDGDVEEEVPPGWDPALGYPDGATEQEALRRQLSSFASGSTPLAESTAALLGESMLADIQRPQAQEEIDDGDFLELEHLVFVANDWPTAPLVLQLKHGILQNSNWPVQSAGFASQADCSPRPIRFHNMLRNALAQARSIFCIHNLAYQGIFDQVSLMMD